MVDVCLLGTGGMMPLKDRWLTSCYIEYNGKGVLIDCGEGTPDCNERKRVESKTN